MPAAAVVATNIPAIDNLTLTTLVPCANGVIIAIQAWRDARLDFIAKAGKCGNHEGDLNVPAGIALLIQRLFQWIEDLAETIKKAGEGIEKEGKSVFEKGVQPQLKFKFDMTAAETEAISLDYEQDERFAAAKDTILKAKRSLLPAS